MKLHIGNLPKTFTQAELQPLLAKYGEASTVEVVSDPQGQSRGYAFAEFNDADQARAAIAGMNGTEIGGQSVTVAEARPRKSDAKRAQTPQA